MNYGYFTVFIYSTTTNRQTDQLKITTISYIDRQYTTGYPISRQELNPHGTSDCLACPWGKTGSTAARCLSETLSDQTETMDKT
jgi:hypothetical protein